MILPDVDISIYGTSKCKVILQQIAMISDIINTLAVCSAWIKILLVTEFPEKSQLHSECRN